MNKINEEEKLVVFLSMILAKQGGEITVCEDDFVKAMSYTGELEVIRNDDEKMSITLRLTNQEVAPEKVEPKLEVVKPTIILP